MRWSTLPPASHTPQIQAYAKLGSLVTESMRLRTASKYLLVLHESGGRDTTLPR